jgi:hypothetical protein
VPTGLSTRNGPTSVFTKTLVGLCLLSGKFRKIWAATVRAVPVKNFPDRVVSRVSGGWIKDILNVW